MMRSGPAHSPTNSGLAVAWLQAGVGVVQVSRWLGNAQPTVTMNVYGDWVPDEAESPLPEPKSATNVVALPVGRV